MKQRSEYVFAGIEFDPTSKIPIYRQVYERLRLAILARRLRPGERLPPSRELAKLLGVSRTTILLAFDHLLAEGYVQGKTGSGTFVNDTIPDHLLQSRLQKKKMAVQERHARTISKQGHRLKRVVDLQRVRLPSQQPFRPGVPALNDFPADLWVRIAAREARRLQASDYGYAAPHGYLPLREALASYLRIARAVRCEPEQVLIVNGSQQGIDLICKVLLDSQDEVWIEDPGYIGAREAFVAADAGIVPIPLTNAGIDVMKGAQLCPHPKLIYVSPSHQYPVGAIMSLARRLQLLDFAAKAGAWIVEDDYDSEFRYTGHPVSSLQGIDDSDGVIYLGTLSKAFFPALRLGYLAVPPQLVDTFAAAKWVSDRQCSTADQAALAAFISEGHFGRHIRRMRLLYQERQLALMAAAAEYLSGLIEIRPSETGLHVVGWLKHGIDDAAVSERAAQSGIVTPPLSAYSIKYSPGPGLVLGYAPYNRDQIRRAVQKLALALS